MIRSADRIARAFGIDPDARQVNVEKLYLSTEQTPGAYWLQLFIATGIAHLGLTLNSTAVIIGAMLVSPLMTPIVQVGMGFAIGHLHLTMRATIRLLNSIIFVAIAAAILTKILPISEVTSEIIGRTQPTFLDMIVALFCGLAASFTHARGSRDVITAAAGTAIAIALVPPICVIGFGIGKGSMDIAGGATMLFTANLAAIILVSDVFFLITGFGRLDFERLEQRIYKDEDKERGLYRLAAAIWPPSNRHVPLRLILPLGFVLSVSVPLYRALSQVVAQVQAKEAVNAVLNRFEKTHKLLSRGYDVREAPIAVWVTMVGEPGEQAALTKELTTALDAKLDVPTSARVDVVPSSDAIERIFTARRAKASKAPPQVCPEPPDLDKVRAEAIAGVSPNDHAAQVIQQLDDVLAWATPTLSDGRWLGWSLSVSPHGRRIELEMLGLTPPAGAALDLLGEVVKKETGIKIADVQVLRVPPVLFDTADFATINVDLLAERLDRIARRRGLAVRLTLPKTAEIPEDKQAAAALAEKSIRAAVPEALRRWMQVEEGAQWRMTVEPPMGRSRLGSEAVPVTP